MNKFCVKNFSKYNYEDVIENLITRKKDITRENIFNSYYEESKFILVLDDEPNETLLWENPEFSEIMDYAQKHNSSIYFVDKDINLLYYPIFNGEIMNSFGGKRIGTKFNREFLPKHCSLFV